jgi:phage tail sheath protein FI
LGVIGDLEVSIGEASAVTGKADFLCVPDLMAVWMGGGTSLGDVIALQLELIAASELVYTMTALLDPPPGLSPKQMYECRRDLMTFDSWNAALYYPWIKTYDSISGIAEFVPPCGHVAGMIARVASTVGPHRSPAQEPLSGVIDTEVPILKTELDLLHPRGINCIASLAGEVMVLGARTLSSDKANQDLSTKRAIDLIARNLTEQMRWVLHEPNEPAVWELVAFELETFFDLLFRSGVLGGADPEHAYMVRCDGSTNPLELIELGLLSAEVAANLANGSSFKAHVVFFRG